VTDSAVEYLRPCLRRVEGAAVTDPSFDVVLLICDQAPDAREQILDGYESEEQFLLEGVGQPGVKLEFCAGPDELLCQLRRRLELGSSVPVVVLGPLTSLGKEPWHLVEEIKSLDEPIQLLIGFVPDELDSWGVPSGALARDHIHLIHRPTGGVALGQSLFMLISQWQLELEVQRRVMDLEQAAVLHEAEILQQQADLADTLDQLQKAHMQLLQADKMASIGQLAAGVAHEINNPIGFISSNLSSLAGYMEDVKTVFGSFYKLADQAGSEPSDELKEIVSEVRGSCEDADIDFILEDLDHLIEESLDGAQRVRRIVADLRDFSHVGKNRVSEEDVNALLEKTINVAWNELKYKTQVEREFGDLPTIRCYGGKLGQVFLNLIVNAAQAIEEQGKITIRSGCAEDHVWIEVEDDGCGMSKDVQGRIFEPFFTTKDVGKGTGLGLHLAYTMIQAHGGEISVESEIGKGTRFHIVLPIAGPPDKDGNEKADLSVSGGKEA
jgi:signal transduction histidine kinase